jgi:hypothetical protein
MCVPSCVRFAVLNKRNKKYILIGIFIILQQLFVDYFHLQVALIVADKLHFEQFALDLVPFFFIKKVLNYLFFVNKIHTKFPVIGFSDGKGLGVA